MYTLVDYPNTSTDILNYILERVKIWSDQWLANFNPGKTKLMNIFLKKNTSCNDYPVYFNGVPLTEVSNPKHLGS